MWEHIFEMHPFVSDSIAAHHKQPKKMVNNIQKEILIICNASEISYKESQDVLFKLLRQLREIQITSVEEIILLISLHRNLSVIKNRKASFSEETIASSILVYLPLSIQYNDESGRTNRVGVLQENYKPYQREAIKMSSELLKYGKEIVASVDDKSKRYKNRVKEAIRMLNELQQFYNIDGLKELFKSRIEDKDADVQFFALYGLEEYYQRHHANMTKIEEQKIREIVQTTGKREIVSTCCQVLINAKRINELQAVMIIDDWKDKNWNT